MPNLRRAAPAPRVDEAPRKGDYFVHRDSGEVLRLLRVGKMGYTVQREGIGQLTLPADVFQRRYTKMIKVADDRQLSAFRSRRVGELELALERLRDTWVLTIAQDGVDGAAPQRQQVRFRLAADALHWYEELRGPDDVRRFLDTWSSTPA